GLDPAGGDHLAIVGENPSATELVGHLGSALAIAATDRNYLRARVVLEARQIHHVDPPTGADNANAHFLRHGPLPRAGIACPRRLFTIGGTAGASTHAGRGVDVIGGSGNSAVVSAGGAAAGKGGGHGGASP